MGVVGVFCFLVWFLGGFAYQFGFCELGHCFLCLLCFRGFLGCCGWFVLGGVWVLVWWIGILFGCLWCWGCRGRPLWCWPCLPRWGGSPRCCCLVRFCSGRARPCCRVLVLLSVLLVFWGVVAVGGSLGAFGGIGDARSHLKRERGQGYWCVMLVWWVWFLFVYYIWYRFVGGVSIFCGVFLHSLYYFCFWCMVVVYVVDKGRPPCWLFLDDLEFCYGFCFCLWLCCFSCWAGGS